MEAEGDPIVPSQAFARASPEGLDAHVPGVLVADSQGPAWKDLPVRIFRRQQVQDTILIPAVAEPLIVWVISGAASFEERELGGAWRSARVEVGSFFLTHSLRPCEVRWTADAGDAFEVMHLYIGLTHLRRAMREVFDVESGIVLRELSGERDPRLVELLRPIHSELTSPRRPSLLLVQGLAQALAVHVLREYSMPATRALAHRGGLPAYKLQRAIDRMTARVHEDLQLEDLANHAGLSQAHFSRAFKRSTGLTPTAYLVRLRMAQARRLLHQTTESVISVAQAVGYDSASHFAKAFRAEVGVTPTEFRALG